MEMYLCVVFCFLVLCRYGGKLYGTTQRDRQGVCPCTLEKEVHCSLKNYHKCLSGTYYLVISVCELSRPVSVNSASDFSLCSSDLGLYSDDITQQSLPHRPGSPKLRSLGPRSRKSEITMIQNINTMSFSICLHYTPGYKVSSASNFWYLMIG